MRTFSSAMKLSMKLFSYVKFLIRNISPCKKRNFQVPLGPFVFRFMHAYTFHVFTRFIKAINQYSKAPTTFRREKCRFSPFEDFFIGKRARQHIAAYFRLGDTRNAIGKHRKIALRKYRYLFQDRKLHANIP